MENQAIKDRVKKFCDYKKIPIIQFEQLCGLSNGYVSSMRKSFGQDKLKNVLSAFPELNREWLLYGEGEMLKGSAINVNGDNNVGNGNGNNINSDDTIKKLTEHFEQQLKVKDAQIAKYQEQMDILLRMLEKTK